MLGLEVEAEGAEGGRPNLSVRGGGGDREDRSWDGGRAGRSCEAVSYHIIIREGNSPLYGDRKTLVYLTFPPLLVQPAQRLHTPEYQPDP